MIIYLLGIMHENKAKYTFLLLDIKLLCWFRYNILIVFVIIITENNSFIDNDFSYKNIFLVIVSL